jgi:branched-chain amino acid aminotransferase
MKNEKIAIDDAPGDTASGKGSAETRVWLDGEIVDLDQARVSVQDHGLLYGDGVFEGIRARSRRVFRLDDHLARIGASARAIALEIPLSGSGLRDVVLETIRALGSDDAYVRLVVTRGEGPLGVDPLTCPTPRVFCIATRSSFFPEEKVASGIDLVTVSSRRPAADALDPRVKSLNYLQSCMTKLEARRRGADDG